MREKPTWRIPFGILGLVLGLILYALAVMSVSGWIGQMHVLIQTVIYIVLGTIWLLPLKNFMIWMETGYWGEKHLPPTDDA